MKRLMLTGLAAIMIASSSLPAQNQLSKADRHFELKAYGQALNTYQQLYNADQEDDVLAARVAACYAALNNDAVAADWYGRVNDPAYAAEVSIDFGHVLKRMGKYDEAKETYLRAIDYDRVAAEYFSTSCDFAQMLLNDKAVEVFPARFNTRDSDFGLSFYKGVPVFASFANNLSFINPVIKEDGNRLYSADQSELLAINRVYNLRPAMKANYGLGPIAYDGDACAFTHNYISAGARHFSADDSNASIHLATTGLGGDFADETAFDHNGTDYATAHPCLVAEGTVMFFASNRPGGYGGWDIYRSDLTEGVWTAPVNLGPEVNTVGNEVTPVVQGDQLVFASDYHFGLGGFDLFETKLVDGMYTAARNLGPGINSPADDYYPAFSGDNDRLYFTSNRLGGRGNDDIYVSAPLTPAIVAPSAYVLNSEAIVSDQPSDIATVSHREVVIEEPIIARHIPLNYTMDVVAEGAPVKEAAAVDVLTETTAVQLAEVAETQENVAVPLATEELITTEETEAPQEIVTEAEVEDMRSDLAALSPVQQRTAAGIVVEERVVAPQAYRIPNLSFGNSTSDVKTVADVDVARRVWSGNDFPPVASVYFVQLAAFSKKSASLKAFENLVQYGNIYKVYTSTSTKVRLGYFSNEEEARTALRSVRAQGYRDAFVTFQPLDINKMELVYSSYDYDISSKNGAAKSGSSKARSSDNLTNDHGTNLYEPSSYMVRKKWDGNSRYKVRLASYENAKHFDLTSADDIGRIEQWTKGGWTIFLASGYANMQEAEQACRTAKNKGFRDAEVVLDNDGILERIKRN